MEQFKNGAIDVLTSGINNSDTTITVSNGSYFPTTGYFRLRIENEILVATARSGNNITVVRGQEGTTAVAHNATSVVSLVLTAAALNAFRGNNIDYGAYADRGSNVRAGRLYLPSDTDFLLRDSGSIWQKFWPMQLIGAKPISSDFTTLNGAGTFSIADSAAGIVLTSRTDSGCTYTYKSTPARPFTITVRLQIHNLRCNYSRLLLMLRESSTGKAEGVGAFANASHKYILSSKFSAYDTWASDYLILYPSVQPNVLWLKVNVTDTQIKTGYSVDGINWKYPYETHNLAAYFTTAPNQVGILLRNGWTDELSCITINSWDQN